METKFFLCKHCGNMVGLIHEGGGTLACCGDDMIELVPNTTEAATEKHIPVVEVKGHDVTVNIGSVDHPMLEEHHIAWVYVKTSKGGERHDLVVGGAPRTEFSVSEGEEVIAVYAYCNLHGLWKAEI